MIRSLLVLVGLLVVAGAAVITTPAEVPDADWIYDAREIDGVSYRLILRSRAVGDELFLTVDSTWIPLVDESEGDITRGLLHVHEGTALFYLNLRNGSAGCATYGAVRPTGEIVVHECDPRWNNRPSSTKSRSSFRGTELIGNFYQADVEVGDFDYTRHVRALDLVTGLIRRYDVIGRDAVVLGETIYTLDDGRLLAFGASGERPITELASDLGYVSTSWGTGASGPDADYLFFQTATPSALTLLTFVVSADGHVEHHRTSLDSTLMEPEAIAGCGGAVLAAPAYAEPVRSDFLYLTLDGVTSARLPDYPFVELLETERGPELLVQPYDGGSPRSRALPCASDASDQPLVLTATASL